MFLNKIDNFVNITEIKKPKYCEFSDLLFVDVSENKKDLGKCISYLSSESCLVGNHIIVLKHNENPKYLSYVCSTNFYKKQIQQFLTGTTVFGITLNKFKLMKVPLPSLEEQQKIVDKIDLLYNSIERLKIIIPELIGLNKLRLQYYINKLTNPKFLDNETT